MLFGTNIWNWQNAKVRTQGHTSVRYYFDTKHGVPAQWPELPAGLTGIVSIRPQLDAVAARQLDDQLLAFMNSAPSNMWLTLWHEANAPKKNINPTTYKTALQHMRDIAPPWVRVGQILETYPVNHDGMSLLPWVDENLDFHLLDGYQLTAMDTPPVVFGTCIDQLVQCDVPVSKIGIAETNSAINPSAWCADAMQYAVGFMLAAFGVFAQDDSAPPPTFLNLPMDPTMAMMAIMAANLL